MEQGLYHLAALLLLLGCVSAVGALLCFWEGRWRFFRGCVVLGAATVAAATVCLLAGLISVRGGDRLQLVESAGKWYVELEPHLLSQAGLSPQVEQAREEIRASYEADAGPDVTPRRLAERVWELGGGGRVPGPPPHRERRSVRGAGVPGCGPAGG